MFAFTISMSKKNMTFMTLGCPSDNAPSMQLGLRELAKEKGVLLVIGCAAHILNLCIRDNFKLPVCAEALKELHAAISVNKFPRYAETRWNE